jgi:hypothetical protein
MDIQTIYECNSYNDTRQCKWRSRAEASDLEYTTSIANLGSSTNGIVEWHTSHLSSQQLHRQLFVVLHNLNSYLTKLSDNGHGGALPQVEDSGMGGQVRMEPCVLYVMEMTR